MAGVKKLRRIHLGAENPAGTPKVPATTIWRGLGTLEDLKETVFVEEDVGYLSGLDRTMVPKVRGQLVMDDVPATFEQLPYILMAGIELETATADGGGSGQIWEFPFPTTAPKTLQTYTIEGGDDQEAEKLYYCFVPDFRISGAVDEALKMMATWEGRQVVVMGFSSPNMPDVEEILFNQGELFIDTVAANVGDTLKSNVLISAVLNVDTGNRAVQAADGEIYFSYLKQKGPEITLEVKFEHDGTATAEKVFWRTQIPRQIRLKFEGSLLGTAAVYTYKTLIIDMAGKWEKFSALEDQDGNDIVTGTFRARYNATAALFCEILMVNELATLP